MTKTPSSPAVPPAPARPRPKAGDVETLRNTIDAIDLKLHDLIMERAEAVEGIAAVKRGALPIPPFAAAFRPAREAQILRRLAARHHGGLPVAVIVRLWREIISAKLMLQSPFAVTVFGGEDPFGIWDLARAHFGQSPAIALVNSALQVLQDCAQDPPRIGVLPWPAAEAREAQAAWWTQIGRPDAPRVVACLPFLASAGRPAALAVSSIPFDPSGDDLTFALVEVAPGVSRARLTTLLKQAELAARIIAAQNEGAQKSPTLFLILIEGYVIAADPRLSDATQRAQGAIQGIALAGGFARPIADRPDADTGDNPP